MLVIQFLYFPKFLDRRYGDCYSAFVRCRAFEGLQEYFYVFGKWFLVFFKNDIWSDNIFFSFRIDRKIAEDKVYLMCIFEKFSFT